MDNGKQSDVLVIDFSKAFDKVSHPLLVHKLKHYGIIGNINTWIKKAVYLDPVYSCTTSSTCLFDWSLHYDLLLTTQFHTKDAETLQADLGKLATWEQNWKMAFHPENCNVISISRKRKPVKFSYTLHGHILESVPVVNYLGCNITRDLKWNEHIDKICNKANNTLGFLKRNLNIGSTTVKENAYKSLVRPTVECACTWNPYQ